MTRLRSTVVAALAALAALVLGSPGLGSAAASSPTNPDQADGPGIITIEQLNMCMWGSTMSGPCFPNTIDRATDPTGWQAAENQQMAYKKTAMLAQFSRHIPDVVTVSEGCLQQVQEVAQQEGYQLAYEDTGGGTDHVPRYCTVGNHNIAVNAILAKKITSVGPKGYFEEPGWRSYVCAQVSTGEWPSVHVCTAHLSLKSQGDHQDIECAYLRDHVLDPSSGPTLFAGDVNMSLANENCAPTRFHGLKDLESTQEGRDKSTVDGLQHIYYSAGFWRMSCGWAYYVEHTDHKGFLLELADDAHMPNPALPDCWRNIRS